MVGRDKVMKAKDKIEIDVMKGEQFYKTLLYDYNPLFRFDNTEMKRCLRLVTDKLPSIKNRMDVTLFLKFTDGHEEQMYIINE